MSSRQYSSELYACYIMLSLSSSKNVISTGGKQKEDYSSPSSCHWNRTRGTFVFQAQAPDGYFDCLNDVVRLVGRMGTSV